MKRYLFLFLALAFIFLGISAYIQAKPEARNDRIYNKVKENSPYYLQKRLSGITILSKENENFNRKPTSMDFYQVFDSLQKEWGKKHLKLTNTELIIFDNNGTHKDTIKLQNEDEINFIRTFYGV